MKRFADNEVWVTIDENVRGEDVFVIQSTSYPANDNLMELLICIDALKRASARRITAVIPYFGYARQDRKTGGRTPISAKLVANLITRAGADRVLTMDLHAGQIQGFFDIPTDNLLSAPLLADRHQGALRRKPSDLMIVSPDVGGVVRARAVAKRLNADLAIVDKRRAGPARAKSTNIIGDVDGRRCILFDDIVDSAAAPCATPPQALIDSGATDGSRPTSPTACCRAARRRARQRLGAEGAGDHRLRSAAPERRAVRPARRSATSRCALLIGEAIRRIANEESVSNLFD